MWTIHYPPLRVPALSAPVHSFAGEATLFYRLRPPSNQAASSSHLRRTGSVAAPKSAIPDRARFLGSPTVYFRIHDRFKGHLRRYIFQQVLERRGPGHVFATRNQPDGARDVWLPRLGAHCRQLHPHQLSVDAPARLFAHRQGPVPNVLPPHGVQTRRKGCSLGVQHADTRTELYHEPHPRIWSAAPIDADQTLPSSDYTPIVQETRVAVKPGNSGAEQFGDDISGVVTIASDADGTSGSYRQDPRWQGYKRKLADRHRTAPHASTQRQNVRVCRARRLVASCPSTRSIRCRIIDRTLHSFACLASTQLYHHTHPPCIFNRRVVLRLISGLVLFTTNCNFAYLQRLVCLYTYNAGKRLETLNILGPLLFPFPECCCVDEAAGADD